MSFETEAQDLISEYLLTGPASSLLDEAVPSEVVVQMLGTDTLEHVYELLEP